MANVAPQVNVSSPGTPASANVPGNKYQTLANNNPNNIYKNYNFPNMYLEQSGKQVGKKMRFSLSCNSFTFKAHLDPEHITDDQGKRLVQIDVLSGIVLQDFGYTVQNIELRGSTGAAYYDEIAQLDTVFNNQSTTGTVTPATLVLEGRTYTGVFSRFEFDRVAKDNRYTYIIGFTVLQRGATYDNTNFNYNSAVVAANRARNAIASGNGVSINMTVDNTGRTPADYVNSNMSIPKTKTGVALTYLANQWSSAPQNKRSYPGDNSVMNAGEVLVVPVNWNNVLSGNAATPSSSQGAAYNVLSGAVTSLSNIA